MTHTIRLTVGLLAALVGTVLLTLSSGGAATAAPRPSETRVVLVHLTLPPPPVCTNPKFLLCPLYRG